MVKLPPDLPYDRETGLPTPAQIAWALRLLPPAEALAMITRVAEQTGPSPRLAEVARLVRAQAPKDGAA